MNKAAQKIWTFTYLADAFIQSELHWIQGTHFFFILSCFPWGLNPRDLGVAYAMLFCLSYRTKERLRKGRTICFAHSTGALRGMLTFLEIILSIQYASSQ